MKLKNSDQMKNFLRKESQRLGISIKNTYNTFFSRKLLELISNENKGVILVSGSFSEYVHIGKLIRPITDIDVISRYPSDYVVDLVQYATKRDNDGIEYQVKNIKQPSRTGMVTITGLGCFDGIKQPFSMDIKGNTNCFLESIYMPVHPLFTDDRTYYINTRSQEEHIAEKLCIVAESMQQNGLNSRMKDFYDIYELHGRDIDYTKLSYYFLTLLELRGRTRLEEVETSPLNKEYTSKHHELWERMKLKYEFLDSDVDIEEAVYYTRAVLRERVQEAKTLKKNKF